MLLISTHGWPGSVIELLEIVGPLADPTAHDGSPEDAFDLVRPPSPATASPTHPLELLQSGQVRPGDHLAGRDAEPLGHRPPRRCSADGDHCTREAR
ncbi:MULTISPECIES: hypothetical protein [unclassified Blastococcus]|uniref:hypothetical protein n=1 Tax=unclassified Blastococcus TaxID=2619396 RepID=UPI001EEFA7C4|nr:MULTISPECIES: hypothetical protein [unclassified Blastococcus]